MSKQAIHCHLWLPDFSCSVLHFNTDLPLLSLCYLDHTVQAGRTIQAPPSKHQRLSTSLCKRVARSRLFGLDLLIWQPGNKCKTATQRSSTTLWFYQL